MQVKYFCKYVVLPSASWNVYDNPVELNDKVRFNKILDDLNNN